MSYKLTYFFDSESQSYSVTGYSEISSSDTIIIPNTYNDGINGNHPVTSISSPAFRGCSFLKSMIIPDSVTSIGHEAFLNCSSLTSVEIGNSVTAIDNSTFEACSSLTSITIGNSVTSIGEGAFVAADLEIYKGEQDHQGQLLKAISN